MDCKKCEKSTLTGLYKSPNVRDIVWRTLCPIFEESFENLMQKGEVIESNLVKKAKNNKFYLKELFIEFGFPLESLEDLKESITSLKVVRDYPSNCKDVVDGD